MITSIYPNPVTIGVADPGADMPINQWWGIQAGVGRETAWQGAVTRQMQKLEMFGARLGLRTIWGGMPEDAVEEAMREIYGGDAKTLTPEEANKDFGIEGVLKFDKPITESDANFRKQRAIADIARATTLNGVRLGAWKQVSGFGAMIAGQMFNDNGPFNVDFGLSVFPFFGVEKGAVTAAQVGWKAAIMLPGKRLPAIVQRFPAFSETVLNGATASLIGSTLNFIDAKGRDEETHFIKEVAIGTVMSGLFHAGFKATGKVFALAAERLRRMTPETLEVAERIAQQQAVRGEPVRPLEHAVADESVIQDISSDAFELSQSGVVVTERGVQFKSPDANVGQEISFGGKRFRVSSVTEITLDGEKTRIVEAADQGELQILKSLPHLTEKQARQIEMMSPSEANANLAEAISRRDELGREGRSVSDPERLNAEDYASGLFWKANQATNPITPAIREQQVNKYVQGQDPKVRAQNQSAQAHEAASQSRKDTADPRAEPWENAGPDKETQLIEKDAAEVEAQLRDKNQNDPDVIADMEQELAALKAAADENQAAEKAALDCLIKNGISNAS